MTGMKSCYLYKIECSREDPRLARERLRQMPFTPERVRGRWFRAETGCKDFESYWRR